MILIGVYSIISLNAFCDLSYTRDILPRVSAGTVSKELLSAFCSNTFFSPFSFRVPGTETIYSPLDESFSSVQLILFNAIYEDFRPSLFYGFGFLGKFHVGDQEQQSRLSSPYRQWGPRHFWKWRVEQESSTGEEGECWGTNKERPQGTFPSGTFSRIPKESISVLFQDTQISGSWVAQSKD